MPFKSCTHVKANGLRCGSPALRGQSFCYFHHHSPDHRPRTQARVVQIPFPENAAAIQVGIHNVMLAIIDRRIDERRASQLLWALQIAAEQSRQLAFDNRLHMSQAVTQLPDYELEELKQKEEERRILNDLRTKQEERKGAAHDRLEPHTAEVDSQTDGRSMAQSPDDPILSASSASSAPSAVTVFNHPIVKSSNHQIQHTAIIPSSASPNHPITRSPDGPITRSPDSPDVAQCLTHIIRRLDASQNTKNSPHSSSRIQSASHRLLALQPGSSPCSQSHDNGFTSMVFGREQKP